MKKVNFIAIGDVLPRNIEEDVLRSIVVLLVNVHGTCDSVIHKYLQPLDGHVNVYKFYQGGQAECVTYYIGNCGTFPTAIRGLPPNLQGNDNHSTVVMMADQCFPNLGAIISVGVVCGIKKKAQICDVLVSSKVFNYNYDVTMEQYIPIGKTITVSRPVVKLFTQPVQWPNDAVKKYLKINKQRIPNVKSGMILSGPYIVGDPGISGLVRNFSGEAIGIEMDGANLFVENQHIAIHTIIVKAVCDLGDGKNIQVNQHTAALLAANLVHTGLSHPQAPEILQG